MWVAKSWHQVVDEGCWSATNNNIHRHFAWELRYQILNNVPTVAILCILSAVLQLPTIIFALWG